jgi:hypothetical protein
MTANANKHLSTAERELLKLLAPRYAQAGLKDWHLVTQLLDELEHLERDVRLLLPHLPAAVLNGLPLLSSYARDESRS